MVYEQHERYLASQSRHMETLRDALLKDLKEAITQWQAEGDRVIIGIDSNKDVRNCPFKMMSTAMELKEAIITRHHNLSPPATC
jgi:hypothetical protein